MKQKEIFLQPGEFFVGDASHRIRTVLGSCVSVTLWNPIEKVGAMSHFLLATRSAGAGLSAGSLRGMDGRYGDEALQLMLHELRRRGTQPALCQAKIFGGGDMFPRRRVRGALAIGRRNGEAARQLLQARGIEVISESLFGEGHRQIAFDVNTGHVWARQLPPSAEPNTHFRDTAA